MRRPVGIGPIEGASVSEANDAHLSAAPWGEPSGRLHERRTSTSAQRMRTGERQAVCGASMAVGASWRGEGEGAWRSNAIPCARRGEFGASTPRSPGAVDARGRDQRGQQIDEFQRPEG